MNAGEFRTSLTQETPSASLPVPLAALWSVTGKAKWKFWLNCPDHPKARYNRQRGDLETGHLIVDTQDQYANIKRQQCHKANRKASGHDGP